MKDEGSGGSSTMIQIPSSHSGSSKSVVGGRYEISPKIHPKLEEDIEGSSENPLDKTGDWLCEECKLAEETENQKQGLDAEGKMENKLISSTHILSKRHIENLEGASAPKRQVVDGSPRSLRPNEEVVCSLTSGPRLQTPKGSLLKCSSFNTLNSNSKSTISVPPASNSRLSPLPLEHAGFSYDHGAIIDIPLDTASGGSHNQDLNKKVQAKEAELKRQEQACCVKIWLLSIIYFVAGVPRAYVFRAMKLYTTQSGSNKRVSLNWINILCPRQSGGTECGYYVCKFMKEIVENILEVLVNKNVINSNFGKGSRTVGASDVPTSLVEVNAYSQPVSRVLDSEETTSKLQKKLEELHLPQRQHV
ncbi:hypothetical protein F3Y22_tig00110984pilonHSYRG00172 [Hibiscus syriacus]|uniref:Ubiquitin-like protease family profile domain-containing protein n=1 Tax=Hibiscus syriacus TaxID=106335 RepID=A0A6A2ZAS9_HIBSY|nr:hypothetical protein F3Y22_tig00110984pilonHSYRG00172 [Hibiscus syriacus]